MRSVAFLCEIALSLDSKNPMDEFRNNFPPLKRQRNGKPPIYLDNACTTLVPQQVIESLTGYYRDHPACGGRRSHHWFAGEVTASLEGNPGKGIKGSRQLIAEFIHAGSEKEILFTLNTTHAINTVALGFNFEPGDVVLLTDKEHNSNLIPWLRLQNVGQIRVERIGANQDDRFDLQAFEQRLKNGRVRLVSMAQTSNLTGHTIPAKEIIKIAHQYGARVLLDGAQTVPHQSIDVQTLDVDFLAFSMHKMCGPRGIGVLYAKKELLSSKPKGESGTGDMLHPTVLGGGTANDTTYQDYSLLDAPDGFEAGIQNYAGTIASGAAIQYLQQVGIDRITAHEYRLNRFLTEELLDRYGDTGWFKIFGPQDPALRGGILTFEVKRPNAIGIASELDRKNNIMIRDGVFCVHSYFNNQYGQGWMHPKSHREHRMIYRVSFYLYNTIAECQAFVETLDEIFKERCYI
ncbi:MAG TPA: aminotransferase class V-fold PLP-dependent enzyme [Acidobacteriota bacterium]|nr:aminotransferase class V-fold PLP-dependent enzyme [Acidobacteriota bacterium]